jgi:general L-amino acid transport system substrate-binding protein
MKSSSWYDVITQNFPPSKVVGTNGLASSILAMNEGLCNVIGGTRFDVQPESIEPFGLSSDIPYVLGNRMHTKSFETWQTTASDRQWTKFISWVFEALVQAEESGITKSTALERMAKTDVFGEDFEDIFINAVLPHGNFGELWDKTMPFPRAAMNQVCDGTSGLILSMDFGAYYDEGPRPSPSGHIEKILQRGALKCEVREAPGFGTFEEQTGLNKGLEVDICKAVAAALFKGQVKVDFVAGFKDSTFQRIQSGEIDLAMGRTRTLQREVKHSQSKGFAYDFSPPYFYDSLTFSGPMPYGRCASELVFNDTNSLGLACSNTKICVPEFSSWIEAMRGPLMVPESNMIVTLSSDESIEKHFASGECNAIAYESLKLKSKLQDTDYLQDTGYYVGTRQHTKEAISAMYLSDDSQFSDLLRWIVYGLFYAEENKITAESFMEMPLTQLFGAELAGIWQNSVKEVGNYGEIFERNLNGAIQRDGFNLLNELDGPQLCASPGTAAF